MKNEYIYESKGKKGISLQIKIPYTDEQKRKFRSATIKAYAFPTKAAAYETARMKRDQMMIDIRNNQFIYKTPTVGELYEEYWEMSALTINTRTQYDYVYRYVAKPLANIKIEDIEVSQIQHLLSSYAENHSDQMIKKGKHIWHCIYLTAQMKGLNIMDKTYMLLPTTSRKPVKKNKKDQIISYDEFVQFTSDLIDSQTYSNTVKKRRHDVWYMLWIMYYTGCRPAEALAIGRDDIDLKNNILTIRKSIGSTKKNYRQIVATKRPASYRNFPIPVDLIPILNSLLINSNSTPLLCDSDGLPYAIKDISREIASCSKRTGIQFNAYQLRHKFSDDMFDNKVSPVVIRDLMGHASSTMSLEYAKATNSQMTEAVNTVARKK